MSDYSEENLTSQSELFDVFPFLQSFPFEEYEMFLEKEEDFATTSGIDPVIISEAGTFVKPEYVNFNYLGKYTKIALSFYTYDVQYILDNSERIKKMDKVREDIDRGLDSKGVLEKIECIKIGEKFLKNLGASLLVGDAFDRVLDDFLEADFIKLPKSDLKKIKAKSKTYDEERYGDDVNKIVKSFYNIHLHHIKILLGIVIAAKIH